jgi:hypothetical protein
MKPAHAIFSRITGAAQLATKRDGRAGSIIVVALRCGHARRFKASKLPPSGFVVCYECLWRRDRKNADVVRPGHVGELGARRRDPLSPRRSPVLPAPARRPTRSPGRALPRAVTAPAWKRRSDAHAAAYARRISKNRRILSAKRPRSRRKARAAGGR